MSTKIVPKVRCAVYTRKSHVHGLEQVFNSLAAQREACEAYIASQASLGWISVSDQYDDGGFSGGTLDRDAAQRMIEDIKAGRIDVVVVYMIDRLSRNLAEFLMLMELFEEHGVTFVSVTQPFSTTTSAGRLMLNNLLSFAQFEREMTGERIRDKIAASKAKGMWMGAPCRSVMNPAIGSWSWSGSRPLVSDTFSSVSSRLDPRPCWRGS